MDIKLKEDQIRELELKVQVRFLFILLDFYGGLYAPVHNTCSHLVYFLTFSL